MYPTTRNGDCVKREEEHRKGVSRPSAAACLAPLFKGIITRIILLCLIVFRDSLYNKRAQGHLLLRPSYSKREARADLSFYAVGLRKDVA